MKMYLKETLYHELTIAGFFIAQKAKTEAQPAKSKVTPDTTVMRACQ